VLAAGAGQDLSRLGAVVFAAHLPVAAVEGLVLGFTAGYLRRAKPELLGKNQED
jgi:ABC-type Co2+ transport system permease subunit